MFEICPCCGHQVAKLRLEVCGPTMQLSFLGSGFPLFYNFIVYCIFILFVNLIIKGGYNLITNLMGNYCG